MAKKLLLNLTILLCAGIFTFAQNTYTISGIVKDQKETLPGAAIYVSGYKIATVTNNEGKFTLPKLPAGNYDILVQMIGYFPISKNVIISDQSVQIDILLKENATTLNEVVIKPDLDRAYHLAFFRDNFIGKTPNAENCVILNPDVLTFNDNTKERLLTASASDFLIIENKSLGYHLKYLLEYFEYDYNSGIIFYAGHPHYQEMKGNSAKQKKWANNRLIAYNGSIQHFFKSLYNNTATSEGFAMNKLRPMPNPMRKPDSVISANIKRLSTKSRLLLNGKVTFTPSDSLTYWYKQKNEPKTVNAFLSANVLTDTLVKVYNADLKAINYEDILYVIYKNEKESLNYNSSGQKQNRPPGLENFQISIVNQRSPIRFYKNGGIDDPKSILYGGYWAYEKMADMVPLDYEPPLKKK